MSSSFNNQSNINTDRNISSEYSNVLSEVKGLGQPTNVSGKAEVYVQTKETWDLEALKKLEEKIAMEKSAIVDAEKLFRDQSVLYNEALKASEAKMNESQNLQGVVGQRLSERDRWLNEEKELELRRAAAHAKAVECENARAEILAQAVLAQEESKVSQQLSLQRQEGMKQAQALVDAHRLALVKLEEHRQELKRKEVDVSVRGEALPQPRAVDIQVAVKPKELPEARVASAAVSQGAGAQSHIQEHIPAHQKTVIPAREVAVSEQHAQQTQVEHHVVSSKDRVVM
jgi:plasmid stability protein